MDWYRKRNFNKIINNEEVTCRRVSYHTHENFAFVRTIKIFNEKGKISIEIEYDKNASHFFETAYRKFFAQLKYVGFIGYALRNFLYVSLMKPQAIPNEILDFEQTFDNLMKSNPLLHSQHRPMVNTESIDFQYHNIVIRFINQLRLFAAYVNNHHETAKNHLPDELIEEVSNLVLAVANDNFPVNHLIGKMQKDKNKTSSAIIQAIYKCNRGGTLQPLEQCLMEGNNPNTLRHNVPLFYALELNNIAAFKLLLIYSANPFLKSTKYYRDEKKACPSPIEHAFETNQEAYSIVENAYVRKQLLGTRLYQVNHHPLRPAVHYDELDYSLAATHQKTSMNLQIKYKKASTEIRSSFNIDNKICLKAYFKNAAGLLPKDDTDLICDEKKQILELYKHFFELNHDNHPELTSAMLDQELRPKNTWIEIIRFERKVIGFFIFGIQANKDDKNVIFECRLGVLDEKYRHFGLSALLLFGKGFAIQMLFPHKNVIINYLAIHYNSFRLTDSFTRFPLHQSGKSDKVEKTVRQLYGGPGFFHNRLTCYAPEELLVKEKTHLHDTKKEDYRTEFFKSTVLGNNSHRTTQISCGAPVLFYAGRENLERLAYSCYKLSINPYQYITLFAKCLLEGGPVFLSEKSDSKININEFPSKDSEFWQDTFSFNAKL